MKQSNTCMLQCTQQYFKPVHLSFGRGKQGQYESQSDQQLAQTAERPRPLYTFCKHSTVCP